MVVAMRLARYGRRHAPYYRIMVADSRRARDGKFIEHVGSYNPLIEKGLKHLRLNTERITYWLSVGAQPSETVARLLEKANILPPRPRHINQKAVPLGVQVQHPWLANAASPQVQPGQTALPAVSAQEWWKMVRGRHVPGLAGANEFHIDSPLDESVLSQADASLNQQPPVVAEQVIFETPEDAQELASIASSSSSSPDSSLTGGNAAPPARPQARAFSTMSRPSLKPTSMFSTASFFQSS